MELYLRWLEKYEMEPGEEAPIGLILCTDKRDEQIELLQLDKSGIRVASYLTELPPQKLLEQKYTGQPAAPGQSSKAGLTRSESTFGDRNS
jgi:hypothetical protein